MPHREGMSPSPSRCIPTSLTVPLLLLFLYRQRYVLILGWWVGFHQ